MPRPKGSADLLENRRWRALALLDKDLSPAPERFGPHQLARTALPAFALTTSVLQPSAHLSHR